MKSSSRCGIHLNIALAEFAGIGSRHLCFRPEKQQRTSHEKDYSQREQRIKQATHTKRDPYYCTLGGSVCSSIRMLARRVVRAARWRTIVERLVP